MTTIDCNARDAAYRRLAATILRLDVETLAEELRAARLLDAVRQRDVELLPKAA